MAPRVLVIQGSESGAAINAARGLLNSWSKKEGLKFDLNKSVLSGNEAGKKFAKLKDSYDVLLVLTSTFGEGDPPSNFERMLYELTAAGQSGARPLAGMQHAVLGFGDSTYETFMNCPRLVDKLMEECGSRRLHQRFEIDAGNWSDEMAAYEKQWMDKVFDVLQSEPKASDASVGSWKDASPKNHKVQDGDTGVVFPKTLAELEGVVDTEGSSVGLVIAVTVGTLAVALGAFLALRRRP